MQTTQKRLNHMLMHIHKERTDKIDLIKVANEFVERKDNRRQIFKTFSPSDISRRAACQSKSTQTLGFYAPSIINCFLRACLIFIEFI